MGVLLWLAAVVIAVAGVIELLHGRVLAGVVLLVIACAVGPGGWSLTR